MKIFLIGSSFLVPWLDYTQKALFRLGMNVRSNLCSSQWIDRFTLRRSKMLASTLPGGEQLLESFRDRWNRQRDRRLLREAKEFKPDLILTLRGETLSPRLLEQLRSDTGAQLLTWWLDDPFRFPVRKLLPVFDHFFIFDRSYIPPLKKAGARNIRFLPCAVDETIYKPLSLTPRETREFKSDVAFIAWYYPGRDRLVQALREFDLKVWGKGWTSPQARGSLNGAQNRIMAGEQFVNDRTAAKIYNAAKIGLNLHAEQTREAGLNARAFELLACGTFELTDAVAGMEELLKPNQEVVVYHSPGQAHSLTAHYLTHPQAAQQITQKGRSRTLREHTYLHRMQTLLAAAGK